MQVFVKTDTGGDGVLSPIEFSSFFTLLNEDKRRNFNARQAEQQYSPSPIDGEAVLDKPISHLTKQGISRNVMDEVSGTVAQISRWERYDLGGRVPASRRRAAMRAERTGSCRTCRSFGQERGRRAGTCRSFGQELDGELDDEITRRLAYEAGEFMENPLHQPWSPVTHPTSHTCSDPQKKQSIRFLII